MSESLKSNKNDLWSVLADATEVASHDIMGERRVRSFFYGLASQRVYETVDGKLILSEAIFESDGAFMSRITLLDPSSESGESWYGRAVNNPDHEGVHRDLSDPHYNEKLKAVESLLQSHPVDA